MLERAFALSYYFLKVRKLTKIFYCSVCGFAFDAYVPSISECRAAMDFHENSLCDSLYLEVAEIENEIENENDKFENLKPLFVWTSFCEEHKENFTSEKPRFVPYFKYPCGYYGCLDKATMVGLVKVS